MGGFTHGLSVFDMLIWIYCVLWIAVGVLTLYSKLSVDQEANLLSLSKKQRRALQLELRATGHRAR